MRCPTCCKTFNKAGNIRNYRIICPHCGACPNHSPNLKKGSQDE